jgi:putative nucleotidyltransferase with HDIG domain
MLAIDEYINKAHHLVPAPHILPQLMPFLSNPNSDNTKIVDLISYDTPLTANVLRVCNSAYYSRGTATDNLLQAVTRLGSSEVYKIVVAVTSAATLSSSQKGYGVEGTELWTHSVATAVSAQLIAKDLGDDENVAFTAGLLHDVGKIILAAAMESIYDKFVEETYNGSSLVEIESKLLGCHHAEVGGCLLERWKLPQHLVAAVRYHHAPVAAKPHERLTACVTLGNFIAYFMGHGYGHHALSLHGRDEAFAILKISPERLPHYMEQCFEKLKVVKSLYGLKD